MEADVGASWDSVALPSRACEPGAGADWDSVAVPSTVHDRPGHVCCGLSSGSRDALALVHSGADWDTCAVAVNSGSSTAIVPLAAPPTPLPVVPFVVPERCLAVQRPSTPSGLKTYLHSYVAAVRSKLLALPLWKQEQVFGENHEYCRAYWFGYLVFIWDAWADWTTDVNTDNDIPSSHVWDNLDDQSICLISASLWDSTRAARPLPKRHHIIIEVTEPIALVFGALSGDACG